jgi:hypothetical protein
MFTRKLMMIPLTLAFACMAADQDNQKPKPLEGPKVIKTITVLDQKTVAFTYGRMLALNCFAVQVAIDNPNTENSYVVNGITVQFDTPEVGSLGKSIVTEMAQRGQIKDRRNVWIRTLNGMGLVAASVSTFAHVGPSYASAVIAFTGPFVQGISNVFPDLTAAQVANVGTDAFQPNLVVAKDGGHAVMTAFFSLKELMDATDRKTYRTEPHELLKQIKVRIRGTYVTFSGTDSTSED